MELCERICSSEIFLQSPARPFFAGKPVVMLDLDPLATLLDERDDLVREDLGERAGTVARIAENRREALADDKGLLRKTSCFAVSTGRSMSLAMASSFSVVRRSDACISINVRASAALISPVILASA